MKILFSIVISLMFILVNIPNELIAQVNLVPNPSFEDTIQCPIRPNGTYPTSSLVLNCQNWYNPSGNSTPDYLNGCAPHITGGNFNVPNNFPAYGWQYARTGVAYVMIANDDDSFKEFVQTELDSILVVNHQYCVEFYINHVNNSRDACNNIGMYFSDIPLLYSNCSNFIGLVPQINDTTIETDTVNWVRIAGSFVATGNEHYITIGNFFSQANTDTLHINNSSNYGGSGYYIDDVSVVDCGVLGVEEEKEDENGLVVYPNPSGGVFEVKSKRGKIKSIAVYNILGEEVLRQAQDDKAIRLDISKEANGLYFIEVRTEMGILRKKFIKQ